MKDHFRKDRFEKRNVQVIFRLTRACREDLRDIWQTRSFPDPFDNTCA